jgi:predicted NUDIX family NTP pyrophosphohydrolase
MNGKRKVAVAALVYTAIFITIYALTAQMTVPSIPSLGGGEGTVVAPANVDSYSWVLEGTPVKVTGATMTFDDDLPSGTKIYLALLDDADVVVASGSKTLTSELPEGQSTTVNTSPSVDAATIYKISVTVVCP